MISDHTGRRKWPWIVASVVGFFLMLAATAVFLLVRLAMSID